MTLLKKGLNPWKKGPKDPSTTPVQKGTQNPILTGFYSLFTIFNGNTKVVEQHFPTENPFKRDFYVCVAIN